MNIDKLIGNFEVLSKQFAGLDLDSLTNEELKKMCITQQETISLFAGKLKQLKDIGADFI